MKNRRGISLIVLVITIIVMIILAGAIILTLGNNRVIENANEAVEKMDAAQIQELAQMGWSTAYANGARTVSELKQGVFDVFTKNNLKPADYGIIVTTKGVKAANGWLQNGTQIVKGEQSLVAGDKITNYTGGTYTGNWVVVGAENGQLLLVSSKAVVSSAAFSGKEDFYTGVDDLNKMCEVYLNEQYATLSRSINVDDINRLTGYDPEKTGTGKPFNYGERAQYKELVTYTLKDGTVTSTSDNAVWDDKKYSSLEHVDGRKLGENGVTSIVIESTNYYYDVTTLTKAGGSSAVGLSNSSRIYGILFGQNTKYWLASTFVHAGKGGATWGLKTVDTGLVSGDDVWDGYYGAKDRAKPVRAVVVLKDSVKLTSDGENAWKLI